MRNITVLVCVLIVSSGCAKKDESPAVAGAVEAAPASTALVASTENEASSAVPEQPNYEDPKFPLLVKGIGVGQVKLPCTPKETTDPAGRDMLKCVVYEDDSRNMIDVTFSFDGKKVIRVERSQYVDLADPQVNDVLQEAVAFYGEPQELDVEEWFVRYGNAHAPLASDEYFAKPDGIGMRIKGYWCKKSVDRDFCDFTGSGASAFGQQMECYNRQTIGTANCPGLHDAVMEYDLIDGPEMQAAWDAAATKRDEARAKAAGNQF